MTTLTTAFAASAMRERGYTVIEGPATPITGGAADSRNVLPGDLFTAFPGENTDGNLYVAPALANGAVAAVCERAPEGEWPGKTIIVAPDATRAVGELAHAWRRHCRARVVGITGTVGKTTAKEMTAAVLSRHFRTHRSTGNFNSREGLPLALLSLTMEHDVSVLEMGMDSKGEIVQLCEIAEPEVGVVLNIGLTHVEKLGSIEAIANEKLSLARWLPESGTAVLNVDDPRIASAIDGLACRTVTFGRWLDHSQPRPLLAWSDYHGEGLAGGRFFVSSGAKQARVDSPLPGEHTVPAAISAMAVAMALGVSFFDAANSVGRAEVEGRARALPGKNGATIIDDRYNASPASMAGALAMLGAQRTSGARTIAFLGKMAELGEHAEAEHRRIGEVAAANCTALVTFGDLGRIVADAAKAAGLAGTRWFPAKEEAAAYLAGQLREGDAVLVKGSRSEALETIIPLLEAAP
ncbi:MAG: UDP-N-acetylmuramoyl-tripeptide--D-alanyl-D-alanine ligase [Dehalococcoidia bacterium]|nr:UDP-N-acetylmuramoyl-tripeptide--D-alanyl-D-alanine ligase [Dehalococcoidia bacterium]